MKLARIILGSGPRLRFIAVVLLTCGCSLNTIGHANDRPNILLIVSEDNGPELGCYGDPFARTPRLDQLAAEGVRFETAYVTQSVCSPSRGTIFTGLYPHQNGQIGLATHQFEMFANWPTTYSILKNSGYRTGLIGKTHVNPESVIEDFVEFRFQPKANFAKQNLQDYTVNSAQFINDSEQPFFLTVNFPDAHWPLQNQVQGFPERIQLPKDVRPMPFIGFDNPRLRAHVQGYYNCLARLDGCVGDLLDALEKSGKADNTLVIYIGDHGAQFARGKVFVTEAGLRIPFVIRWPGKTRPGFVSPQMVSTVDLLPTIVKAAGASAPAGLPGMDLGPSLVGQTPPIRDYLFGERNCDSSDLHYPQRAIRDSRYKLIQTLLFDRQDPGAHKCLINGASNFRGSPTYEELKTADSKTQTAYATWLKPPKYQLYDLQEDPHEFINLADDSKHSETKRRLIERLEKWQIETDDPLRFPELLANLTSENDECKQNKRRSPRGGWQYVNYLVPLSLRNRILFETSRIWDATPHNAFTDLIRWNGKFYCAFRIGTGHVPGENGDDGRIQVISSEDGESWSSVANVVEPGIDLRDPKISIAPDGRLMLLMGGSNYDGTRLIDRYTRVAFLEKDKKDFSNVQRIELDANVAGGNDWLWRVTWHQEIGYGVIYQSDKANWGLHLVKTTDGINYDLVKTLDVKGKPNESTIRFDQEGGMQLVVRNEDGRGIGHYGRSKSPFTDWTWNPIPQRLGGPDMIKLPNGDWILGTREYSNDSRTIIGKLSSNGSFKKLITFPSGGDTSYPGMVVHDGFLWISYYSSHEDRTSIYLAKVRLSDLVQFQNQDARHY